jgi:hypothetical protein
MSTITHRGRAILNMNERLIIRCTQKPATHKFYQHTCIVADYIYFHADPGIEGEEDFKAFIEFANHVEFDSADYH